jgi:hypothetical protein
MRQDLERRGPVLQCTPTGVFDLAPEACSQSSLIVTKVAMLRRIWQAGGWEDFQTGLSMLMSGSFPANVILLRRDESGERSSSKNRLLAVVYAPR